MAAKNQHPYQGKGDPYPVFPKPTIVDNGGRLGRRKPGRLGGVIRPPRWDEVLLRDLSGRIFWPESNDVVFELWICPACITDAFAYARAVRIDPHHPKNFGTRTFTRGA
jgi:hypothetical protein